MAGGGKGKKKKGKKKGPSIEAFEETLQIRVRKRNPLIERKVTAPPPSEDETAAELEASDIYKKNEFSEQTEELDLADLEQHGRRDDEISDAGTQPPTPPPVAAYLDEDETIVTSGPPQKIRDLKEERERNVRRGRATDGSRSATVRELQPQAADGPPEPITDEGPMLGIKPTPKEISGPLSSEVIPKRRLGAIGTDAAGAAVHRAMIERADAGLPKVNSPALKLVRAELSLSELSTLDATLNGQYDTATMDGSISPKRSLEHLTNERAFNELSAKERSILFAAIAPDPRDVATVKAAIALLKTGAITRASDEMRASLLALFHDLDSEGRALVAQLAARQIRGRSAIEDKDIGDVEVVNHLYGLIKADAFSTDLEAAGIDRHKVASIVLSAVANPKRMSFEEGAEGVLGMFEYALAESSPAEYARLWRSLVTGDMVAELAGNMILDLGARMHSEEINFTSRNTPLRVALEQLGSLARTKRKSTRSNFIMPGGMGVDADVISRALGFLYGVNFTVAAGAPTALRHLERSAEGRFRVPPLIVSILYDRGERLFLFDRLEENHVYLRAPHGRSSKRKGATRVDPIREVVDPDLSVDRMPLSAFEESVGVGLVPRT